MTESNNTMVRVTNEECIARIEDIKTGEEITKKSRETLKDSLIESIQNQLNLLKQI